MVITREAAGRQVAELGVKFCPHGKNCTNVLGWWAERLGWANWRAQFWLTIGKNIYHPDSVRDPLEQHVKVLHELVHVRQQAKGLPVWLARYCTSWRFRWQMEREAYMVELLAGEMPLSFVINTLRTAYGVKLSQEEMGKWFSEHLFAEAPHGV